MKQILEVIKQWTFIEYMVFGSLAVFIVVIISAIFLTGRTGDVTEVSETGMVKQKMGLVGLKDCYYVTFEDGTRCVVVAGDGAGIDCDFPVRMK
jgi:hypothetical protein